MSFKYSPLIIILLINLCSKIYHQKKKTKMRLQTGQTVMMAAINLFMAVFFFLGRKTVKRIQVANDEEFNNQTEYLIPPVLSLAQTSVSNETPQKVNGQIQNIKYPSLDTYFPYYQSFVIAKHYHLLEDDSLKNIIVNSLQNLVRQRKIKVFAFVIMPNHFDVIWSMERENENEKVNAAFMNKIGNLFLENLSLHNPAVLSHFEVDAEKHLYNFWEKKHQSTPLYSPFDWQETIDKIHETPTSKKWLLADLPKNYPYSSAKFYEHGIDDFGIISHWPGC